MTALTQERLKEVLNYDPDTGCFTCKVKRGTLKAGDIAGCVHRDGYVKIKVDYMSFQAHRVLCNLQERRKKAVIRADENIRRDLN